MERDHLFDEDRLRPRDVSDGLTGHWLWKKPDEVAGMPRPEGNSDLAVGLKASDAGTMSGAWIDDDEGSLCLINFDAGRGLDPCKHVIDRPRQRAAVEDEFRLIVQDVRHRLGFVLPKLIAALAHHVPEQHAALRRIDHVFHRRRK